MSSRREIFFSDIHIKLGEIGLRRGASVVFHQHEDGLGNRMRSHGSVLVLEVTQVWQRVELAIDDGQCEPTLAIERARGRIFLAAEINRTIKTSIKPGEGAGTEPDESRRRIAHPGGRDFISQ